ncbi:hypothetical protein GCM10007940_18980 [Portibacter lacus]|uniref:mannan endo-1,4-beta-mannosidase n=2 Tax=Portibacter lacus TaxID=1099794 RepID=A0AA37SS86_9BACT|nr:hypothetical protein GCM10007940_18980 [Portibacter lacus]
MLSGFFSVVYGQSPEIKMVEIVIENVERFEKFEVLVEVNASYDNPYDYEEVSLKAFFEKPDGTIDSIDGFYTQQLSINTTSGNVLNTGPGVFKVRYAPYYAGAHTFTMSLQDSIGSVISETYSFNCISNTAEPERGFVRMGESNYLEFDNAEQYIPIGENIAWQQNNAYHNYNEWVEALSDHGGNFLRLWHAHWGLGIEWIPGWNNHLGLKRYNQVASTYQDWLYDYCGEKGVYVMLALQHHGQVSTLVNPNWNDNPYNIKNGGPLSNTWEFFTNEEAIALTKNRLRYIVARWGYARSIMSWELFNEVEWTDNFAQNKEEIIDWHIEMANFIRGIDVYNHLITTSFAHESDVDRLWGDTSMDFTQIHYYNNSSDIHSALVAESKEQLLKYEKPVLVGEFGLGGSSSIAEDDLDGVHIHNAIWSTFLGGSMGTAMSWWWESYIHPSDLYYHFDGPAILEGEIKFSEDEMVPHESKVINAPTDLVFQPTINWGQLADTIIKVDNGLITPASPALSSFLYGSSYNTQFRSPPTFEITNTDSGIFSVTTGNDTSSMARIVVSLDDDVLIDSLAIPNSTYEITVPAGFHKVKVDNTGKDWVSIKEYFIEGQGTQGYSVALMGKEKLSGAGWVLNKGYNHNTIGEGDLPDPVESASLLIQDVENLFYTVTWYETLSGELIGSELVAAVDHSLILEVPTVYWDLAFTLSSDGQVGVDEVEIAQVNIFPNPAQIGQYVNIAVAHLPGPFDMTLFNAEGKPITNLKLAYREGRMRIPRQLSPGMYWLKISNGESASVKPLVIID